MREVRSCFRFGLGFFLRRRRLRRAGKKVKPKTSLSLPLSHSQPHLPQQALHPDVALLHPSRGLRDFLLDRHGEHRLVHESVADGSRDLRQLPEPSLNVGESAAVLPRRGVLKLLILIVFGWRKEEGVRKRSKRKKQRKKTKEKSVHLSKPGRGLARRVVAVGVGPRAPRGVGEHDDRLSLGF